MSGKRPYPRVLAPYTVCAEYVDYALALLPGGHIQIIDSYVPRNTIEVIVHYRKGNPMRISQKRIPIHKLTDRGLKLSS